MGFFDFRKKDRIIDLSEKYNALPDSIVGEETDANTMNIEERRKNLAKRISEMANKLEEISNNLYHLTQRIEVLEKKIKVGLGN